MRATEFIVEGVAEGFPQPGPSSGAPQQFGSDAKIQTRQMTVKDIISSVPGVPYYNNVVDDWDAKDYSWGVTKKVIEYATYLKDHPESLAKLPPAIVLNGKFEDGAHRVSAIWLLQQRIDPKNPLWKNAKLNVQFVKQGVAENLKSKMAAAAMVAANLLGSPAQAAEEPIKPITIAYVTIEGEVKKYNLGDKFTSSMEAEKFISGVLDKQGLQGYHLEIKHGYPKKKNEDAAGVGIITKQNTTADVDKNTPKKNLRAFRL